VARTRIRLPEHWEQIFYGEFDGGRKKRVLVKIIGESKNVSTGKIPGQNH